MTDSYNNFEDFVYFWRLGLVTLKDSGAMKCQWLYENIMILFCLFIFFFVGFCFVVEGRCDVILFHISLFIFFQGKMCR